MIVSFASQKGGVGKTTLALHVANEISRDGERVTVIDADPPGSPDNGKSVAVSTEFNGRSEAA